MGNLLCLSRYQDGDSDSIKEFKKLLSKCKHVDLRDEFGSTPLHKAVLKKRRDMVEVFLNHPGTDVNSRDRVGQTSLVYACVIPNIDLNIARDILNHGADPNIPDNDDIGPLHLACERGNLELVELLIRHQADVNSQDNRGRTPLHYTVPLRSPEVASCLLAHGADADLTNELGMNAFTCLLQHRNDCNESLLSGTRHGDAAMFHIWKVLISPNEASDIRTIRTLLACGGDPDSMNAQGSNKFMDSLQHQYKCNELLLSHTRNLDAVTCDGRTALLLAIQSFDLRAVRMLMARGASLTAHTCEHSPLEAAVATQQFNMFELVWRHTDARTVAETKDFMALVGKHCPFPEHPKHYELILNTPGVDLRLDGVRRLFARILQPSSDQDKEATKSQVLSVFGGLLDRGVRLGTEDIEQILQCFIRPYTLELWTMIFAKTTPDITQYVVGCAIDHRVYDLALLFTTYCLHLSPEEVFRREVPELFCHHWLALFTPTSQDRWAIEDRAQGLMSDRTVQILNETNQVKRLLELSRDAIREAMRGSCRTTQDFLAALVKLEIPSDLKDIIRLRVPVNRHLLETGVPLDVGSCNGANV